MNQYFQVLPGSLSSLEHSSEGDGNHDQSVGETDSVSYQDISLYSVNMNSVYEACS